MPSTIIVPYPGRLLARCRAGTIELICRTNLPISASGSVLQALQILTHSTKSTRRCPVSMRATRFCSRPSTPANCRCVIPARLRSSATAAASKSEAWVNIEATMKRYGCPRIHLIAKCDWGRLLFATLRREAFCRIPTAISDDVRARKCADARDLDWLQLPRWRLCRV